jgi:hypothetical protein
LLPESLGIEQSFADAHRPVNLGSGTLQDNLQAARDEQLVLDHEDRISGKKGLLHEWSSACGHAHLPKAPFTQ